MNNIKSILFVLTMILSLNGFSQDKLITPEQEISSPEIEDYSVLDGDTLIFSKAEYVNIKTSQIKHKDVKFTIMIRGSNLISTTVKDTCIVNLTGSIKESDVRGTRTIMINSTEKESIFIPIHKEFVVFTNGKAVTKLFNKENINLKTLPKRNKYLTLN